MNDEEIERLKAELADDARQYRRGEALRKAASDRARPRAVELLRAHVPPSEVARLSPFTDAYVRRLAREAGIPPARLTGYAKRDTPEPHPPKPAQ